MTYSLTNDQQIIFEKIIEDIEEILNPYSMGATTYLSLTGSAGTGKTYLSSAIINHLVSVKNLTVGVLAPTHQAVGVIRDGVNLKHKNLDFGTIHKYLSLKPEIDNETGEQKFKKQHNKIKRDSNGEIIKKVYKEVLIVDESSMIGQGLFDFIIEEVDKGNSKCVLFIGDACQLFPIEMGG